MSKSAAQYVQAACTALLASVLLSACLPSLEGNEPRDARRETPSGFGGPTSSGTSGQAPPLATSAVAGTGLGARKRAQFFDDPDLRALIDSALENNQELNVRLQEIIIREAEVGARKGEYLPKVEAKMGAGVEKASAYTREGTVDEAFDLPEHMGDFAFGLAGSWKSMLWKKLRNAAQAANYRYLSSIEGKNFFVTGTVAEIARLVLRVDCTRPTAGGPGEEHCHPDRCARGGEGREGGGAGDPARRPALRGRGAQESEPTLRHRTGSRSH